VGTERTAGFTVLADPPPPSFYSAGRKRESSEKVRYI